jgi:hypothetical protein
MLKVNITDPSTGIKARVDNGTEDNALVVATRDLKTFTNSTTFFTNPDFGPDMNQNALAGGTPLRVHDGIDSVLWTASSIQGVKFTFNSGDQSHESGSSSIKIDNAAINDTMQIAKGSSQDLSGYSALSLWVYIDKDWFSGDSISISGWDTGTDSIVGVEINIEDFIDWQSFGIWHQFIISLTTMGLNNQTIDALRISIKSISIKSPKFYIDDIQFEETGEPITFELRPNKGTWLHVKNFTFSIVAPYDGLLGDATFNKLPYNSLLGISVANGLVYQRTQEGIIQFSQNFKTLMDAMQIPQTYISGSGSDGVNSWISFISNNIEPLVLKAENDDVLTFAISDNLSTFLHFRVAVGSSIEDRSQVG